MDRSLIQVKATAENKDISRLPFQDALALLSCPEILDIGSKAFNLRKEKHGLNAYFNVNLHLNLTNICQMVCRFCSYGKKPGSKNGYALSIEEAVCQVEQGARSGVNEVHIVNGLNPDLDFAYYLTVIREIKRNFPRIMIKAFTAVEIDYFAQQSNLSIEKVLEQLKKAGVDFIPGGGAEIFSSRARKLLGTKKIAAEKWLKIHQLAHLIGFKTNATILYGHFESDNEIVNHLLLLRELQDKTGGFMALVPLKFQPYKTPLNIRPASLIKDLKIIALSRLFLDNFPHITAYWVTLGLDTAKLALHFGADDLGGTVQKEKIMHEAGSPEKTGLSREEMIQSIKEAGFHPIERNTFYEIKL